MQRCSDTIGAIAAALAKAQAELTNPEKSLTATIQAVFPREASRTFRYAPLSGGLDIVRKCLGRHEIATVQSTAIDREAGLIHLTTTLAHASGEWIASEWPVCPAADMASPRRMGAALTYARRYALFTLVGIAGEDDLDAPDLPVQSGTSDQGLVLMAPSRSSQNGKMQPVRQFKALSSDNSAKQREELLTELASIGSIDQAAAWAKRTLPTKNTLAREHACEVEAAFEKAIARFGGDVQPIHAGTQSGFGGNNPVKHDNNEEDIPSALAKPVDERPAPLPGRRRRDKAHLKFVASQPCLLCGRQPSDAHHLRFAQPRALGAKVSDEFTVPLCRTHHRQLHRTGNEAQWWNAIDRDIDPLDIARGLWLRSHGTSASSAIV